jgi:predicted lipopolysaccharide heptosyltransferase III
MKPDPNLCPENILLVQLGDIGDVVLTNPTIRAVKNTFPEARVSILVRRPFGSVLLADPNLHEVVEVTKFRGTLLHTLRENLLFARRLRRARYDLVIDLRTGDRGAILSFFTGAKMRVGRHEAKKPFWHDLFFTQVLFDLPYAKLPVHPGADQSLAVVRAMGIDAINSIPKLYYAPKDQDRAATLLVECGLTASSRWVTINPCSRWKYKEWSYDKWGEVIDLIWQNFHLAAVLIGSPEEIAATESIVASRKGRAFNLGGKTTLSELSALLAMSTLHLGVDSAPPHIAAAVGTPTLTIFGPGNWKGWTIADEFHRIVTAEMPCIPCNKKGCDNSGNSQCLYELTADRVYEEARAILLLLGLNRSARISSNAE